VAAELTAAKFKPLYILCLACPYPLPRGFAWFGITSARLLHNLVMLITQVRNFESHMQFADWCSSPKISSSVEYSVLQALQFQEASGRRIPPGGTGISHN
jgi:hypothetical protein